MILKLEILAYSSITSSFPFYMQRGHQILLYLSSNDSQILFYLYSGHHTMNIHSPYKNRQITKKFTLDLPSFKPCLCPTLQ